MQLFGKKSSVSKVDPCGVHVERVGCNSIQYTIAFIIFFLFLLLVSDSETDWH